MDAVIPDFWADSVDTRGIAGEWPDDLPLDETPALVRRLAEGGLWLEQEVIAIDPRLQPALESLVRARA